MPVAAQEPIVSESYDQTGKFAGQYLCLSTMSGGVAPDPSTGKWKATSFNVSQEKFILKISAEGVASPPDVMGWPLTSMLYIARVSIFGEKDDFVCIADLDADGERLRIGNDGYFRCRGGLEEFRFNLMDMRFLRYYGYGYVDGSNNTPNVTIGDCAAL